MKSVGKSGFATAALFPAVMVPITLPVMARTGLPDFIKGSVVGLLLGLSILLIVVAIKARSA